MNNKTFLWSNLALAAILLAQTAAVYPGLPATVPSHWNAAGEVDGWSSKGAHVAMTLGMFGFVSLLGWALPPLSAKNFRLSESRETYNTVMFLILLIMALVHVLTLEFARNPSFDMTRTLIGAMMIVFGIMGNFMGRLRRNEWMGIRTPWTLASDHVWDVTHRVAGRVWFVTGIGGGLLVLMGVPWPLPFIVFMASMMWPILFSWQLARKGEKG